MYEAHLDASERGTLMVEVLDTRTDPRTVVDRRIEWERTEVLFGDLATMMIFVLGDLGWTVTGPLVVKATDAGLTVVGPVAPTVKDA